MSRPVVTFQEVELQISGDIDFTRRFGVQVKAAGEGTATCAG
jgi:hypothetical protein